MSFSKVLPAVSVSPVVTPIVVSIAPKPTISVKLAPGTQLFYTDPDTNACHFVRLADQNPREVRINLESGKQVRIGDNNVYSLVNEFAVEPPKVEQNDAEIKVNVEAGTVIVNHGLPVNLGQPKQFTLAVEFEIVLPAGTKLQDGFAHICLQNNVVAGVI